jgi:putative redox protein
MGNGWKEVVADWRGGMVFIGTNQTGGSVQMGALDGNPGISPMEMLLMGMAGCTGMDIASILEKKRLKLNKLRVQVRGIRADDYPMVWKEIEVVYHLWGESLPFKDIEQAIQLSEEKYCSASIMLRAVAQIRSSYRIYEPEIIT